MTTESQPARTNENKKRGFRFGLRTLLVLFMIAPIAAWFWWRMPFTEEVIVQETTIAVSVASASTYTFHVTDFGFSDAVDRQTCSRGVRRRESRAAGWRYDSAS